MDLFKIGRVKREVNTSQGTVTFEVVPKLSSNIRRAKLSEMDAESYLSAYLKDRIEEGKKDLLAKFTDADKNKIAEVLLNTLADENLANIFVIDEATVGKIKALRSAQQPPVEAFFEAIKIIDKLYKEKGKDFSKLLDVADFNFSKSLADQIDEVFNTPIGLHQFKSQEEQNSFPFSESLDLPYINQPLDSTNDKLEELIELTNKLGQNSVITTEWLQKIEAVSTQQHQEQIRQIRNDRKNQLRQIRRERRKTRTELKNYKVTLRVTWIAIAVTLFAGTIPIWYTSDTDKKFSHFLDKQETFSPEYFRVINEGIKLQEQLVNTFALQSDRLEYVERSSESHQKSNQSLEAKLEELAKALRVIEEQQVRLIELEIQRLEAIKEQSDSLSNEYKDSTPKFSQAKK